MAPKLTYQMAEYPYTQLSAHLNSVDYQIGFITPFIGMFVAVLLLTT